MKLALVLISLISTSAFAAPATTSTYVGRCRFEAPLDTYSSCADGTYAGERAFRCAEDEAISACQESYNSDCIPAGVHYRTIISQEFVGYKACEVTVLVHGYRLGR